MGVKNIVAPLSCLLAVTLVTPAMADPLPSKTLSLTDTSSNGSSTGVGNAGSFGIGSGTSDSISTSTATATSNGYNDSSVHSGTVLSVVADQELSVSNTNNQMTIGSDSTSPGLYTGSTSLNGAAFSNYAGILNNGWNTAPAGNAQAASNVAVNGPVGGK